MLSNVKKRIPAYAGGSRSRNRGNVIVGFLVARARKGKMTQAELGAALGRDQTMVAKIEAGVRQLDPSELLVILDLLAKDAGEFFDELRTELASTPFSRSPARSKP